LLLSDRFVIRRYYSYLIISALYLSFKMVIIKCSFF
jgi:hypothetical protein